MSKFLAAATALFIPLSGQAIVAPAAADTITMTITGTVAPYQFHSGLLGLVMLGTRNISLPPLCCSFPYQRTHKHPQPVNMHQLAHSRHIQCRKMNPTAWKPRAASSADKDIGHANHAQLWPKPNPRSPGPWKGRKLYDLYQATETPREWFSELFTHARQLGIEIFSSVFSPEDVDFLEQFNPAAYKIASMEFTDTNLTGAGKTAASVGVKIGLTFVGAATPGSRKPYSKFPASHSIHGGVYGEATRQFE